MIVGSIKENTTLEKRISLTPESAKNIIGLGLGPQGVGLLSDWLNPSLGQQALRYALLIIVASFALGSVIMYWLASRTLVEDLSVKDRPLNAGAR